MLTLLAQAALICGTSWVLWKFVRQYVVKTALDNLPGPPSSSFLYGECYLPASNVVYPSLTALGCRKLEAAV